VKFVQGLRVRVIALGLEAGLLSFRPLRQMVFPGLDDMASNPDMSVRYIRRTIVYVGDLDAILAGAIVFTP
jgi:hypothetical protein